MNPLVLVVDSDPSIARLTGAQVGLWNPAATIVTMADSIAAVEVIELKAPDLLIAEVNMLGITGPELALLYRKCHENGPVVLVSAQEALRDQCLDFGSSRTRYLSRPWSVAEFLTQLNELLADDPRASIRAGSSRLL
ncbi:MAG: response regulator [Myxococcaceae bacterium]|nr:response regulator [Myxococcaceae bacterium]